MMHKRLGYYWPDGIKETAPFHALRHVENVGRILAHCRDRRYAIQAGGNIGLWPIHFAQHFDHVFTFEPEPVSYACLVSNLAEASPEIQPKISAYARGLGDKRHEITGVKRASLGSHQIVQRGADAPAHLDTIDGFCEDAMLAFGDTMPIDLIQLDVEGYEAKILRGAERTIRACRPVICLELRQFSDARHNDHVGECIALLKEFGYESAEALPGNDFVYTYTRKANA